MNVSFRMDPLLLPLKPLITPLLPPLLPGSGRSSVRLSLLVYRRI